MPISVLTQNDNYSVQFVLQITLIVALIKYKHNTL